MMQSCGHVVDWEPSSPTRVRIAGARASKRVSVSISVKPGTPDGHTIRMSGYGHQGIKGACRVTFSSGSSHPFFERDGADIICEVPISFPQAALGTRIDVPTLRGRAAVKVPAGTQSGKKLRLKGKGLPGPRPGQTGDQLVRLQVETPSHLSDEQRSLLEQFEKLSGGHIQSEPKRQSFLQSLKDFFD